MTVKADSKGRLTGAQPETRYTRKEHPDGRIEYVPEVPTEFDEIIDVTEGQFEDFFGVSPHFVTADDGIRVARVRKDGYLPHGLTVARFRVGGDGKRVIPGERFARLNTLIRIKRDS